MPALENIQIEEIYEIRCPDHGVIGTRPHRLPALALRRHHFEWRHQPNPDDRQCGWRYPTGGMTPGYQICVLDAGHLELDHRDEYGNTWTDNMSVPREGVESLHL